MDNESFGERVRRRRLELRLGLRDTARQAGISPTFLSRVETGAEKAIPSEEVIQNLSGILHEDFDQLMALAGRIPSEVAEFVKSAPGMPEFLRRARDQNLTASQLIELLEKAKDDK